MLDCDVFFLVRVGRRKFLALLMLLLLGIDPISSFGVVQQRTYHHHHHPTRRRQRQSVPFLLHSSSAAVPEDAPSQSNTGGAASTTTTTSSSSNTLAAAGVRQFLGRGPQAVVREGSVLVAPQDEYHHYYRHAAIFIYAIGLTVNDDNENNEEYIIRGVILDHPTPFTWQEMITGTTFNNNNSALGENRLFRGGDKGGRDGVILLHNRPELVVVGTEIGSSGIYQGGWDAAVAAVQAGEANVDDFKAFFNYCEFTEAELESLLAVSEDENGDAWASVEVDSDMVLNEDWDRGDCWKRIRNAISQHMQQQQQG